MRFRLGVAVAVAAGCLSLPALSQSFPVCSIGLIAPQNGAHFIGSRPVHFAWSGEPVGTASRELHLAALDGTTTIIQLDGRFSDTPTIRISSDLAWLVVFRNAQGRALCTTPPGFIAVGFGGGRTAQGVAGSIATQSSSAPVAAPTDPRLVVGFTNAGRLVIVLQNSSYTGSYARLVSGNDYVGTGEDLMNAIGLEIHGNDAGNDITGSSQSDLIFAYGGNDTIEGGAGDDTLVGGAGNDALRDLDPAGVNDVDIAYGEPGADVINLQDGDSLDSGSAGADNDGFSHTADNVGEVSAISVIGRMVPRSQPPQARLSSSGDAERLTGFNVTVNPFGQRNTPRPPSTKQPGSSTKS